jgi:hypothetical protein
MKRRGGFVLRQLAGPGPLAPACVGARRSIVHLRVAAPFVGKWECTPARGERKDTGVLRLFSFPTRRRNGTRVDDVCAPTSAPDRGERAGRVRRIDSVRSRLSASSGLFAIVRTHYDRMSSRHGGGPRSSVAPQTKGPALASSPLSGAIVGARPPSTHRAPISTFTLTRRDSRLECAPLCILTTSKRLPAGHSPRRARRRFCRIGEASPRARSATQANRTF